MSVNAKTVNQRLDDIEKRLEKIEESLKALDFLNNLTQDLATEPKKNSVTKSNSNSSKIEFTLRRIGCVKRDYTNKLEIEYTLDNNYAKATKLIDAKFIINNLVNILKNMLNYGVKLHFFKIILQSRKFVNTFYVILTL